MEVFFSTLENRSAQDAPFSSGGPRHRMIDHVHRLITEGESATVEFKKAQWALPKNLYETVCGMLNRAGGEIFLGVADDGAIVGVNSDSVEAMKRDFANACADPQKLNPTMRLSLAPVEVDGATVLHVSIPNSRHVHHTAGRIFERNEDGDFDITDRTWLVEDLYRRKDPLFNENRTYPRASMADLQPRLFERVRKRALLWNSEHPWEGMSDEALLRNAKMILPDRDNGKESLTLGAILVFGTDDAILTALPAYRTDAILRRVDTIGYDDRDLVITNLLDSYDRLIAFGRKHLPDPFFLEGTERVSIRDQILREVITNMLIHREFMDASPSRFIIEADRLYAENPNKPRRFGPVDPASYVPFSKNPAIARVFREAHYADELGSGVRRLFPAAVRFGGEAPEMVEDTLFRVSVHLPDLGLSGKTSEKMSGKASGKMSGKVSEKTDEAIVTFMRENASITVIELAEQLGVTERTIYRNITSLKSSGAISRVGGRKLGHWEVRS